MSEQNSISLKKIQQKSVSRRNLFRGAVGAAMGTTLLRPSAVVYAGQGSHHGCSLAPLLSPIPGGGAPFKPFGVFVHHNPLSPTVALADISDPSEITDFDGFVGLTHINGGGTGTDTSTGVTTPLAFRADMGFGQGNFIGSDGCQHSGTFAFV